MRKKVLICSNPDRDRDYEIAGRIVDIISDRADTEILPINYGGRDLSRTVDEKMKNADLVVAIGGDGSIMHAARAAAPMGKSIIGVNRGKKGFLADLDINSIELLNKALDGDYTDDRRMLIDVSVIRDGERIYENYAINDAAIRGMSRMLDISVFGDGIKIASFSGDGVVIASPTGSTAYSMSAGGPIVEPGANNIVVTPICSHALIAKSFVLSGDRAITAKSEDFSSVPTFLVVDGGKGIPLRSNDVIEVKKSQYSADFIKVSGKSFYDTVVEKLGEIR